MRFRKNKAPDCVEVNEVLDVVGLGGGTSFRLKHFSYRRPVHNTDVHLGTRESTCGGTWDRVIVLSSGQGGDST